MVSKLKGISFCLGLSIFLLHRVINVEYYAYLIISDGQTNVLNFLYLRKSFFIDSVVQLWWLAEDPMLLRFIITTLTGETASISGPFRNIWRNMGTHLLVLVCLSTFRTLIFLLHSSRPFNLFEFYKWSILFNNLLYSSKISKKHAFASGQ